MENEVGANPAWKEPSRMIVWVPLECVCELG